MDLTRRRSNSNDGAPVDPSLSDSPPHQNNSPYPYDTAVVDQLLRAKRKKRGITSCYPCRQRKVRCDGGGKAPCTNCAKRDHPELCRVPGQQRTRQEQHRSPSRTHRDMQPATFTSNETAPFGEDATPRLTINNYRQELENNPGFRNPRQSHSSGPVTSLIPRLRSIERDISVLKSDLAEHGLINEYHGPSGREAEARHKSQRIAAASRDPVSYNTTTQTSAESPAESAGKNVVEGSTGATIYLGSNSEPALLLGCRQDSGYGGVELNVLSQLAPTTYPFTNVWRPEIALSEILQTLPADHDTMKYWQDYRNSVYPFYPVLVNIHQFEVDLCAFLENRNSKYEETLARIQSNDMSWLSLVFAVLACGAQFSNDSSKERDLMSKVFVCSSFQCLRAANFFFTTNVEQIQSLLLLGSCIRNNTNTNAAWILIGTTARLAQSIGFHEQSVSPEAPSSDSSLGEYEKCRLWWMVVWQDTHLSFSYDRPQSSMSMNCDIPYSSGMSSNRSFVDSVLTLCWIIRDRSLRNTVSGEVDKSIQATLVYKERLEEIFRDASLFLSDKAHCKTLQNHLERLALTIHVGYIICRICRLCLERASIITDMHSQLLIDYNRRAEQVVESFLDLRRLSVNICRSWGFVQNTVSCAVMLGMPAGDLPSQFPQSGPLIERLISVLERDDQESQWFDNDINIRTSGPSSRALVTLKKVYAVGARKNLTELDQVGLH